MVVARHAAVILTAFLFSLFSVPAFAGGLPLRGDGEMTAQVPYGSKPGDTANVEVTYRFRVSPLLGDVVQSGNIRWRLASNAEFRVPRPGAEGVVDVVKLGDIPADVLRQIELIDVTLAVYGENEKTGEAGAFLIDMGIPRADPEKWSFNAPEGPGWDELLYDSLNRHDANAFRSTKKASEYKVIGPGTAKSILDESFVLTAGDGGPRVDVVGARLDIAALINWWQAAAQARVRYEANIAAAEGGIEAITEYLGGAGPVEQQRDRAKSLAAKSDYVAAAQAAEKAAKPFRKPLPSNLGITAKVTTDSGEEITVTEAYERARSRVISTLDGALSGLGDTTPVKPTAPAWQEAKRREIEARPELKLPSFRDCEECPEMVEVPGGEVEALVRSGPYGLTEEVKRKRRESYGVVKEPPFAIGKYEVTVDEFAAFVNETGYDVHHSWEWHWDPREYGCEIALRDDIGIRIDWRNPGYRQTRQTGRHPVVCVTLYNARDYAEWLSRKTGERYHLLRGTQFAIAKQGAAFTCGAANRLCREEGDTDDGFPEVAPVGSFPPTPLGIHDIDGNVSEWSGDIGCPGEGLDDAHGYSCTAFGTDGREAGGSNANWAGRDITDQNDSRFVETDSSAYRSLSTDEEQWAMKVYTHRSNSVGFRVARELN